MGCLERRVFSGFTNTECYLNVIFLLSIISGFMFFYVVSHILSAWWGVQTEEAFRGFIDASFSRQLVHLIPVVLLLTAISLGNKKQLV